MEEVTLMQMLDARERRVNTQNTLMEKYGRPVICFTMNIPGPIKNSPLIRRSFFWGLAALEHRLSRVLFRLVQEEVTGCTAFFSVDMPAEEAKRLCVAVEECCPMGRLFDMDVLQPGGEKLNREDFGGGSRDCIVCGQQGRGCASRRVHSVLELQEAAKNLMLAHFRREDGEKLGTLAGKALLDEVCTTPKPGLVDRNNSGSHGDMDIFTFMASASALIPYFAECVGIGMATAAEPPEVTFSRLRQAGLLAEQKMYAVTGGVNTHKGAIFTMGLLCGAAGRLWNAVEGYDAEKICREVAAMTADAVEQDFRNQQEATAGERLYAQKGVRGVRGEAARGLPSVLGIGLPVYEEAVSMGMDRNRAGVWTLLHLVARVEDTNLMHRGGEEKAKEAANRCRMLTEDFDLSAAEALDRWFIGEHLSPGGCADLLAAVYFLFDIVQERK